MSHLTSDGQHVASSANQPLNSLVPPQQEKRVDWTYTDSDTKLKDVSGLVPPQEEKADVPTGSTPLAQRGADLLEKAASKLPLDTHPDADPARDRALGDSVRAGVVDDVGVEEQRRVYDGDTLQRPS